jgi:hypothetical protein
LKVFCESNSLGDQLLTAHHRAFFEDYFGQDGIRWGAEPGQTYTVHGISISRGYPFYWLRIRERPNQTGLLWDWRMFPSICFQTIDPRPSSFWRVRTGVHNSGTGNQYFYFKMHIQRWIDEPRFLEQLVDGRPREHEIMMRLGDELDAEFV